MARSNNFQVRVTGDTTKFDAAMGKAQRELHDFNKAAKAAFSVVGIASFTAAFRAAAGTIADFERANSELAAVLGTNLKGVEELTKSAKELGRTTEFTATEVTQLQIALSRLGFNTSQIEAMQKDVLNFALAMGTDLASAADFAGSAIRAFGLEAKDTTYLLDVMSAATTNSALDFSKLQTSLANVGAVAHAFGLSLEETDALLGVLVNNGLDAGQASISLRNILIELSKSNGKLATGIGHTVHGFDDLMSSFKELKAKGIDLSGVVDMTNNRIATGTLALLDQTDAVEELKARLNSADGSLQQMADTMGDNLLGSTRALKSAWQGFILQLEESKGPMRTVVDQLTAIVNRMTDLMDKSAKLTGWEVALGPIAGGWIASRNKKNNAADNSPVPGGSGGGGRVDSGQNAETSNYKAPLSDKEIKAAAAARKKAYQEMIQAAREAAREAGEVAAADAEMAEAANEAYEQWRKLNSLADASPFSNDELMMYAQSLREVVKYEAQFVDETALLQDYLDRMQDKLNGVLSKSEELAEVFSEELVRAIESGLVGSFEALAEVIGGVTDGSFANVAKAMIEPLADMAIRVGTLIMLSGEAIEALKASLTTFFGGSAVLAGAALIGVGVAAKAGLAAISQNSYAASSSYVATSAYGNGGDYETRDVNVHVSGQLQADGDQLVAVINNTNNRNGYTT